MNGQMLVAAEIISVIYLTIQIIASLAKNQFKTKSSLAMTIVMLTLIISSLADITANNLGIINTSVSPSLISVFQFLSTIGGQLILLTFTKYFYLYLKEKTELKIWVFIIPACLLFTSLVCVSYSALTGQIYTIKGNSVEMTGFYPLMGAVAPFFNIFYIPIIAISKYKKVGFRSVLALSLFGIFPSAATIIAAYTGYSDFSYPACCIACSIVNILVESKLAAEKTNEMNGKLQEQLDIIQSMTNVYFSSYYIDIKNDSYIELKSKDSIKKLISPSGKAQENLNLACEKLVIQEYSAAMKEFFDLSTIQQRMKDKKVISMRYVGVTSGWSMAYLIAGDRDENGKLLHIFYSCRTIHDEVEKEEAQKSIVEEYNNIISNAGLGVWYIKLQDGVKPKMRPNRKMEELLGIENKKLTEEEVYEAWHSRIVPEAIPSVEKSVNEMLSGQFSENTYLWNHPSKGNIYVRCGGTSRKGEDGSVILSGYHADVTHIVMQEALKRRTESLEQEQKKMAQMNVSLLSALGTVVEFRSLESGDHVKRVMTFTKIILQKVKENYPEYKLTDEQIELISQAAALHDVGKVAIPDDILKAPRKLTPEEFTEMKKHTIYGCEILERFKFVDHDEFYKYCYEICRWHHEKADGKGYPDGLTESEIPVYCQVTALADCFDALVSKRVYKDAKACSDAYEMIAGGQCGIFSDTMLKCFSLAKDELFATAEAIR